jgi:hypothetical protein
MIAILILILVLLVFGLFAVHVVRFRRSSPEQRREIFRFKALWPSLLLLAGLWAAIGGAILYQLVGTATGGAFLAAHAHLREQYGWQFRWHLNLSLNREEAEAGRFRIAYTYGIREGVLLVELRERDGKNAYTVTPLSSRISLRLSVPP